MSFTYPTLKTTIANLMGTSETDADFEQIFPAALDYANNRIYREGDFLNMQVTDTGVVTANVRDFTVPSTFGRFLVIDQIVLFTPAGSITTRNPITPASLDTINALWPSDTSPSAATVPTWFAVNRQTETGNTIVTFGPSPGANFNAAVTGSIIPVVISDSNPTTYLGTYLPELLEAAIMVFMTGYQKNFGSQADDPKMSQSWEQQYQTLMASAKLIEDRKTFQSQGWTSKQPATPPPR